MSYAFYVLRWVFPIRTESTFAGANRVNGSYETIQYVFHAVP